MTINIITLNKDDKQYTNFKSFSINKSLENFSGEFNFEASVTDDIADFPFKVGDAVSVAVDGENIMTGYIDKAEPNASTENRTITLTGRDKVQDIIDSKIEAKTIDVPITMEDLIKNVSEQIGYKIINKNKRIGLTNSLNEISIINNAGTIQPFNEKIDIRSSETGWNIIRRYAEKRQLIITSNGDGNIVISKIGASSSNTIIQNFKDSEIKSDFANNNIKSVNFSVDISQRYNRYVVKSNLSKNPEKDGDGYQFGEAFDNQIRSTRVWVDYAPMQMTSEDCKRRAEWEANIRKANSIKYSVTLAGFRQNLEEGVANFSNNPLWQPNQLVLVADDFNGIEDDMLVKSVTFTKEFESGTETRLELIDKLAYTLALDEPKLKRSKKPAGGLLFAELGRE
jgi:prophage tail gpP-like protein